MEIRDRKSRSVYVEASFSVETGEAERIAVDWTARGGERGTSCKSICILLDPLIKNTIVESHLQTQRAAVKMLHDRIQLLVKYLTDVIAGTKSDLCRFLRLLISSNRTSTKRPRNSACTKRPHRFAPCKRKQRVPGRVRHSKASSDSRPVPLAQPDTRDPRNTKTSN